MKTIAIASLCSLLSFLPAVGADGWMTDFEAAKKKAAAEKKSLLIDFTGSDWCPPCQALKREVLDQEIFSKGVVADYILVELDFPREKSNISEETIAQNEKLADEYSVEGFPTICLTDAEGRPFGITGYRPGGPEAYLTHLATFREKLVVRDKAMAELKDAEGEARVAALETILNSVPEQSIAKFYGAEFEELSKASPESELVVSIAKAKAKAEQDEAFNKLFESKDFDGVVTLVDKIVKEQKLGGLAHQQLLVYKVNAYVMQEDYLSAVATLDEVTSIDKTTQYGEGAQKYKMSLLVKQVEKQKAEEAEKGGGDAPEGKPDAPKTEESKPAAPAEPGTEGVEVVPGKQVTPTVKKPSGAVSPPAKLEVPKEGNTSEVGERGKKEGRQGRRGVEKRDPAQVAKSLPGKSEEEVRKGLDRVRGIHKRAVNKVNNTDRMMVELGKEAAGLEQEMKRRRVEAEEAKAAFLKAKEGHAVLEKEHHAAHKDEERIKKLVGLYEGELSKRGEVEKLDKETKELKKKVEQVRKKAEKLKAENAKE